MRIETRGVCFLQIVFNDLGETVLKDHGMSGVIGLWVRHVGPVLSYGTHPEYSDRKQLKERSL